MLEYASIDYDLVSRWSFYADFLDEYESMELLHRRYRHDLRCAQYVFARLLLKLALSRLLGAEPQNISIRSCNRGRPLLYVSNMLIREASLSISHNNLLILVMASVNSLCGIDIQGISGIDWNSVIHVSGWSRQMQLSVESVYRVSVGNPSSGFCLAALVWSAYEAWMKLTNCCYSMDDFAWAEVRCLHSHTVTGSPLFEVILAEHCPYNHVRIVLSVGPNEVIAISGI